MPRSGTTVEVRLPIRLSQLETPEVVKPAIHDLHPNRHVCYD